MRNLQYLYLIFAIVVSSCTGGARTATTPNEDGTGANSSGNEVEEQTDSSSSLDGTVSIQLNNGASFTTSLEIAVNVSASGYTRIYLTETAGCATGGEWEPLSSTNVSYTLSSSNATTAVYAKFSDDSNSESDCVTASITHDGVDPTAPTNFDDGFGQTSVSETPNLTWTASTDAQGIARYEVAIGSSQGATNILDWQDVGSVTTAAITSGLSLTDGSTYYASVRAVDVAGRTSTAAEGDGWVADEITCPTANGTFIPVPAYPKVGITESFCIAKYEMKNVGGAVPGSQPLLTPWSSIDRANAIAECNSLDGAMSDYFIPSNAHWQAIARNIEKQAENWSSDTVGTGSINFGHNNGTARIAADADDANACANYISTDTYNNVAVSATCDDAWHPNKRTHTLSNGEVIWDFAGNLWEFVSDNVTGALAPDPALNAFGGDAWREFTLSDANCSGECFPLSDASNTNRNFFGPEGDYDSSHGVGQIYFGDSYGGIILRGGPYADSQSGMYSALFYWNDSDTNPSVGFRCAWLDQ